MRSLVLGVMIATAAIAIAAATPEAAAAGTLPSCSVADISDGYAEGKSAVLYPAVGVEASVEVGESMIDASLLTTYAIHPSLQEPIHFEGSYGGGAFDVTFPAGPLLGSPTAAHTYESAGATFKYRRESRPRTGFGAPEVAVIWNPTAQSHLMGRVTFGFIVRTYDIAGAPLSVSHCSSLGPTGFRREIVYSGVSRGVLSLLYREYTDGLARPAFTQQLTYDLSDGDEIGYKGARFKVLKATNTSIRYVVLKPLGDGS
jgi:hypothetical protein